jgi:CO/xanthine dehydrogenase FAD-binding subunit
MKPASFSYNDPRTIEELLQLLAAYGSEAKVLAGGQSLVPMMNFRLARPQHVIDINRIKELTKIEVGDKGLTLGAMARQADVEADSGVQRGWPIFREALNFVGHTQTRNRGTVGGSLAHNDPAAELPALMLLLDASVTLQSLRGSRRVTMDGFFDSYLSTVIASDECLTEIEIPSLARGAGSAFMEVSRRHGDFALVAAGAVFIPTGSGNRAARIVVTGVADRPVRLVEAERVFARGRCDDEAFAAAAHAAEEAIDQPNEDIHAPAWYRRHVTGVLVERVCRAAAERVVGGLQ